MNQNAAETLDPAAAAQKVTANLSPAVLINQSHSKLYTVFFFLHKNCI